MDKTRRATKEKPHKKTPDLSLGDASGITIADMFDIVRNSPFTGDFSWMPSSPCMDDEGRSLYWPAVVRPDGLRWCQAFKELNIPIDFVDFVTFQTCLFEAVDKGTYETAKFLLDNRADVNHKDKKMETCLWHIKNLPTLQLLISHNADVNTANAEGEPASFYFLRTFPDDHKILEALLDGKADPCVKTKDGLTPLHMAKSPEQVRLLVEYAANVNDRDKKDHTCLWLAVRRNCAPVVKALITHKAEIEVQDSTGQSLLLFAIEKKREDVCMELLAKDTPPLAQANLLLAKAKKARLHEVQQRLTFLESEFHVKVEKQARLDNFLRSSLEAGPRQQVEAWIKKYKSDAKRLWENGRTLLFFITNREVGGTRSLMEYLLSLNIDINARDNSGRTALFHCAVQGSAEVMRAMLDNDADPNIPETGANTALIAAVEAKSLERVEVLLEAGVPVDCVNSKGETALIKASGRGGSVDIVKALIRGNAEVNLTNRHGKTPLFCACDVDIINALVEADAEVDWRDTHKRTTLFQLSQVGNTEAMSVLIKLKADVNAKDSFLETPIFHSVQGRQIEAMQLLLESDADLSIQTAAKSDIWDLCVQVKFSKGLDLLGQNDYKVRLMDAKNNRTTKGLSQKINRGAPAKEIISLIQEQGVGVAQGFMKETFSQSILFTAAKRRTDDVVDLVEFLLDTVRLDLELADDNDQTVLFYAARFGTVDVVKTLLNRKGSVEKLDKNGDTPLHYAVLSTNMEDKEHVFRLLLDAKASVNTLNVAGKSSLFLAMQAKSQSPLKLLIDNKADVNMVGPHGATALCFAHKVKDVSVLLEYKADIEAKDGDGKTPVFHLSSPPFHAYHSGALGLLLASMANVDHKISTPDGERTALALTIRSNALPEIVLPVLTQLLTYGADPTPYVSLAVHPKIVELLQCFPRIPPRSRLSTKCATAPASVSVQVEIGALQSLPSSPLHPSLSTTAAACSVSIPPSDAPAVRASSASAAAPLGFISAEGGAAAHVEGLSSTPGAVLSSSTSRATASTSTGPKSADAGTKPCLSAEALVPPEAPPATAKRPCQRAGDSPCKHRRHHQNRHRRLSSGEHSHTSCVRSSREEQRGLSGGGEKVYSEGGGDKEQQKRREPRGPSGGGDKVLGEGGGDKEQQHRREPRGPSGGGEKVFSEGGGDKEHQHNHHHQASRRYYHRSKYHGHNARQQGDLQASPQDDDVERKRDDPHVVVDGDDRRKRSGPQASPQDDGVERKRDDPNVVARNDHRRWRSDSHGLPLAENRRLRSDPRVALHDDGVERKRGDPNVVARDDNWRKRSGSHGVPHEDGRRKRSESHVVSHDDSRRGRSGPHVALHEDNRRMRSDPHVALHDDGVSRRRGDARVAPHEDNRRRRSDPRVSPHEDSRRKQSDDHQRKRHDPHVAIHEDNPAKRSFPAVSTHDDSMVMHWGDPHVPAIEDNLGKRSAPHGSVHDGNSHKRSRHARRPQDETHVSVHHDTQPKRSNPRKRSVTTHGSAHDKNSRHRSGDPHISSTYEEGMGRTPCEPRVSSRMDHTVGRQGGDLLGVAWNTARVDMSVPRSVSTEPEGSLSPPPQRTRREYSSFSLPMDDWLNQSQSCEDTPPVNNVS